MPAHEMERAALQDIVTLQCYGAGSFEAESARRDFNEYMGLKRKEQANAD